MMWRAHMDTGTRRAAIIFVLIVVFLIISFVIGAYL